MKKIILFLVIAICFMNVVMATGYNYGEQLYDWISYGQTPENTWHAYTGGSQNILNVSLVASTISYGTELNLLAGDFNGNYSDSEYIMSIGNQVYVLDTGFNVKDYRTPNRPTFVTASPSGCSDVIAKTKIMYLDTTGIYSRCLDANRQFTTEDHETFTPRSQTDAIACGDVSFDYGCFVATASGYVFCDINSYSLGTCTQFSKSDISAYSGRQIPAVKDIDGDGDLDAVFYTQNASGQVGWTIVDKAGHTVYQSAYNLGINGSAGDRWTEHYAPEIFNNNYIAVDKKDSILSQIHRWYIYDYSGVQKYNLDFCHNLECYYTNIVERDSNDDGFIDEVCTFGNSHNKQGIMDNYYQKLACFNINTGVIKRSGAESQAGGAGYDWLLVKNRVLSRLITTEYYPTKIGNEIFWGDGWIVYTNSTIGNLEVVGFSSSQISDFTNWHSSCSGTEWHTVYAVPYSCLHSDDSILVDLFNSYYPDIINYDANSIKYYETHDDVGVSLASQCNNGLDDDSDGYTDYPVDFCCSSLLDNIEACQCNNAIDDDSDNYTDYPADTGCTDLLDDNETNAYTANTAPYFLTLFTNPAHNKTNLSENYVINATGFDTNEDPLNFCIDADFIESHEIGYNINTSPYLDCNNNQTNYQTTLFTLNSGTEAGSHWKIYISDGIVVNFGEMDEREGNVVFSDTEPVEYLCIWARERGTANYVEGIQLAIHDFYRAGAERVWSMSHGTDWIRFSIPNGTYSIYSYDRKTSSPHYYNTTSTSCTTTATPCSEICNVYLDTIATVESQLSFLLRDSITYNPIENVNVTLISPEGDKKYTSPSGSAWFGNLNFTLYEVSFKKDGYYDKSSYYATQPETYTVSLVSLSETGNQTQIEITVKDFNTQQPIQYALVTMSNPFTYETYYGFTGTDGKVTQMVFSFSGSYNWQISIQVDGYADKETSISVQQGVTNTQIIFINREGAVNYTTSTGCQNYQKGIWLCGQENIHCTEDSQCDGRLCDVAGYCSSFNWSWCDANNRPRNNRCVAVATGRTFTGSLVNWILDNFLWVLIFIILLILITMVVVMLRKRV